MRGPEDRAIVLMVDNRYLGLLKWLPRWFAERVERPPILLNNIPQVVETW